MITTIITAAAVYVATSIDNLFILLVFFTQYKDKPALKRIVLGTVAGTTVLIAASLLAASGLRFVPQQWVIGLLGFVPISIGVKAMFEQDGVAAGLEQAAGVASHGGSLFVAMTLITIASGGDNLGAYIPLFASLKGAELTATVLVFYLGVAILNYAGYRLAALRYIGGTIEKYERIIVPLVFIGLGIVIIIENGTFATFMEMLR